MKRKLALGIIAILNAISSQAAYIDWQHPKTISGDNDISKKGYLVFAYYFTGSDRNKELYINGVTFNSEQVPAAPQIPGKSKTLDADLVFHNWDRNTSDGNYTSPGAPFANLSEKYQALLSDAQWTAENASTRLTEGTPISIELTNLRAGKKYLVQIWGNDSRAAIDRKAVWSYTNHAPYDEVTLDLNTYSNNSEGGVGQYVIGTFTADSKTQMIYLIGGTSANLSAIQLREVR